MDNEFRPKFYDCYWFLPDRYVKPRHFNYLQKNLFTSLCPFTFWVEACFSCLGNDHKLSKLPLCGQWCTMFTIYIANQYGAMYPRMD